MSFLNDGLRLSVNEINGLGKGRVWVAIVGRSRAILQCLMQSIKHAMPTLVKCRILVFTQFFSTA